MQSYCLPCPPALRAVSQLFSILRIYLFYSCWCAPPQLWSTRKKAQQRWSDRRDGRATNAMNRSGDVVQHNAAQLTVVNLGIFSPTDANFLLHGYLLFHSSFWTSNFHSLIFTQRNGVIGMSHIVGGRSLCIFDQKSGDLKVFPSWHGEYI